MPTLEEITGTFFHSKAWTDNTETYHDTVVFEGHGTFCDVYFDAKNKVLIQSQVDTFNDFENNFARYLPDIEKYIQEQLRASEQKKADVIRNIPLTFDVIVITQDNPTYNLVLVCGKMLKRFLLPDKSIDLRIEFKDGKIQSARRKKDVTEPND